MSKLIDSLDMKLNLSQIVALEKFVEYYNSYDKMMSNFFAIENNIKDILKEQKRITKQLSELNKLRTKENFENLKKEIDELEYKYEYNDILLEDRKKEIKKYSEAENLWSVIIYGDENQKYDNTILYKKINEFLDIYSDIYEFTNNQNFKRKGIKSFAKRIKEKRNLIKKLKNKDINIESYLNSYDIINTNISIIESFNNDYSKNIIEFRNKTQLIDVKAEIIEENNTASKLSRRNIIDALKKEKENLQRNKNESSIEYDKKIA